MDWPDPNRKEVDMIRNRILPWGLAALALGLAAAAPAAAQQIARPGGDGEALSAPAATTYDPERVRTLMLSIHGYTREALDAASTDVPEILMMLAGDGQEQLTVRRQAVKGLSLYPSDEVLTFIENRVPAAPPPLKRLYLNSLGRFGQSFPDRVGALAETYLNDPELTVRYSALKLASQLESSPRVRTMLQSRLTREPDAQLRSEIEKRLALR